MTTDSAVRRERTIACPVFPGKRYLDWKPADPAGQGVEAVRPIREEIRTLVEALIEQIAPAAAV